MNSLRRDLTYKFSLHNDIEWIHSGDSSIWSTAGGCYAGPEVPCTKFTHWGALEVDPDRICRVLWSFWLLYQIKVSYMYDAIWIFSVLNAQEKFQCMFSLHVSCRYLSYVMNVATPTKDCLELLHELLVPVLKTRSERNLTRQEVSILKCIWIEGFGIWGENLGRISNDPV